MVLPEACPVMPGGCWGCLGLLGLLAGCLRGALSAGAGIWRAACMQAGRCTDLLLRQLHAVAGTHFRLLNPRIDCYLPRSACL